jgi:hypothetical protein
VTYSLKKGSSFHRLELRTWLMMPPRKAMSLPARKGAWMSAIAVVRVKRGSAWTILAPASLACIT